MVGNFFSNKPHYGGVLCAFGATLGFSAKAIFVKLAYRYQVDAVTLLTLRMVFSLPFFLLLALWSLRNRNQARLSLSDWRAVIVLGLLGYYISSLLDFWGLQYISASLERLVIFLYPTLTVLLTALFLGKALTRRTLIALLISYAGIGLVFMHELLSGVHASVLGMSLVFASVVSYAIYLVWSGEVIARVGALRFTAYAMTISCLAVLLHAVATTSAAPLHQPSEVYALALGMAIFSTVLPALLLAYAMRYMGADQAALIGSSGPVATIFLANIFLGEALNGWQWIGSALVLGGVLFVQIHPRHPQRGV